METASKILYEGGQGEIVEKKSRFIANIFPVTTEEEALEKITAMRKKYYDARHNCFAYILGENKDTVRCSDDGEPSGTAGRPMLDILDGQGIYNVVAVVTRYFGGTLLGTGGLVRAYSGATKEGIANSSIITKEQGKKFVVDTDYNGVGKLQYIAANMQITIMDTQYTDKVIMTLIVPLDKCEELKKKIVEATAGKAEINDDEKIYFAMLDGEPVIF